MILRGLWRLSRHEWSLAVLSSLLLAALLTWPTLRDPGHTIPQDLGDPTLQAWQLAWAGYAIRHQPLRLWDANAFYPEHWTFAYSDTLLGYLPASLIGAGPGAALVRYNILFVLAYACAFVGAYALLRQLGANWAGSAVAGVAFACAPWRLAHSGHLNVLSTGGIALALAMLARGHGYSLRHGYRPHYRRAWWALAGWLVAAWQITLGFGLGIPFGYALGLICLVVLLGYCYRWLRGARPPFGRRLFVADLVGMVIFLGVVAAMAVPYLEVVALHPYGRRSLADVALFSPPLPAFVTAPDTSWLWGQAQASVRAQLFWPPEMTLMPGVMLSVLAIAGMFASVWRLHQRLLLAGGVAVSVALAMGTTLPGGGDPGYVTLYRILPGWDALRTSGRLVMWTTLLLGILAAGLVSAVGRRLEPAPRGPRVPDPRVPEPVVPAPNDPTHPGPEAPARARPGRPAGSSRWRRAVETAAMLVPLALVMVEGANTTAHPVVWSPPTAMRGLTGPLLVLPAGGVFDDTVLLWTTDGFPKVVNGLSGMTPASQNQTRQAVMNFPDRSSVAYLREIGVRTVLFLPGFAADTPWQGMQDRPVTGLGIDREEINGDVVYRLD